MSTLFGGAEMAAKRENPLVRLFGAGPDGARCKTCCHLEAYRYGRTFYKCALRINTRSPRTDHRVRWPACAKYDAGQGAVKFGG